MTEREAGAEPDDIDKLVAQGDAEALVNLAESADKSVAKAARRGLYLLRVKGVKVPAPIAAARPREVAAPSVPEEPVCLMTSIDALGERVIWLARAEVGGHLSLFETRIHDERGMLEFRPAEIARKHYRNFMRGLLTPHDGFAVVAVPYRHARAEVEQAYRLNLATGRAAPVEFTRVRPQLGKAEPVQPPALERWPEAPAASREAIEALHEMPECLPWIPEQRVLEPIAQKLAEVEESRVLVDARQKRATRAEIVAKAAAEYFADAGRRERMRARLLDAAYMMVCGGREADGAVARAAAEEFLAAPGETPGPFAARFFDKCFKLAPEAEDEAAPAPETRGGLIVPP